MAKISFTIDRQRLNQWYCAQLGIPFTECDVGDAVIRRLKSAAPDHDVSGHPKEITISKLGESKKYDSVAKFYFQPYVASINVTFNVRLEGADDLVRSIFLDLHDLTVKDSAPK